MEVVPTHLAVAVACQEAIDGSLNRIDNALKRRWPKMISVKKLRYVLVPAVSAFFAHGLLDLFTKVTFHHWEPNMEGFTLLFIAFFITVFLFGEITIKQVKGDTVIEKIKGGIKKGINRLKEYWMPILFGCSIDLEHAFVYHSRGRIHSSHLLPIHKFVMDPWEKMPGFNVMIDNLPSWTYDAWAAFIEIGLVFIAIIAIHLFLEAKNKQEKAINQEKVAAIAPEQVTAITVTVAE